MPARPSTPPPPQTHPNAPEQPKQAPEDSLAADTVAQSTLAAPEAHSRKRISDGSDVDVHPIKRKCASEQVTDEHKEIGGQAGGSEDALEDVSPTLTSACASLGVPPFLVI